MKTERGNILFLILLAVVLFAALSYAVTQSTRGGGNNATAENAKAGAASLFQFYDQLDAAILRMRMTGGIPIENISFQFMRLNGDGNTQSSFSTSNCTVDTCKLFKPDGGGAVARNFTTYALAPDGTSNPAPGENLYVMMDFPYAGTSLNDIVVTTIGIKPEVCAAVNDALGITAAPVRAGNYVSASQPTSWDNAAYTISANASQLVGKSTFAAGIISGSCVVHHLLIAR